MASLEIFMNHTGPKCWLLVSARQSLYNSIPSPDFDWHQVSRLPSAKSILFCLGSPYPLPRAAKAHGREQGSQHRRPHYVHEETWGMDWQALLSLLRERNYPRGTAFYKVCASGKNRIHKCSPSKRISLLKSWEEWECARQRLQWRKELGWTRVPARAEHLDARAGVTQTGRSSGKWYRPVL